MLLQRSRALEGHSRCPAGRAATARRAVWSAAHWAHSTTEERCPSWRSWAARCSVTTSRSPAVRYTHAPMPADVELYQRTYSTLLRSRGETKLRILESTHRAIESSLHPL